MYFFDSSALIECSKNTPTGKKINESIGDTDIVTSSLSVHEIMVGTKTPKDEFITRELIQGFRILSFDKDTGFISAQLHQSLQRKGTMINLTDIFIAAVALQHDATLITLDKDFEKIEGLKVQVF